MRHGECVGNNLRVAKIGVHLGVHLGGVGLELALRLVRQRKRFVDAHLGRAAL